MRHCPAPPRPDRTSASLRLPPKCHLKHGAVYYVHQNKWTRLCDADASLSELYTALAEATKPPAPDSIDGLLDAYIAQALPEKRKTTQKSYEARIPRLRKHFGHMAIPDLTPMHCAMFLEGRRGQKRGVSGNRELAILSAAYNFGMRQGWAQFNPCRGVARNTERPRRRFIRDGEWREALSRSPIRFRLVLQFAELTGLRQGDIRRLTWDQITPEGIEVEESKTGKRLLIGWSDDLAWIVYTAAMLKHDRRVFLNKWGRPWDVWGIQSAMRRLDVDWTFHDIRARAESLHPSGLGLLSRYKRAKVVSPVR